MAQSSFEAIVEDFEYLDDWDDRYKYLIELGNGLDPLTASEHNSVNKVQGCVSQVWIVAERGEGDDPALTFRGDSDAHIVRGLIAVALALFSGNKASQIAAIDSEAVFGRLDLKEHISPQRSNGLRSMIKRIKQEASLALAS